MTDHEAARSSDRPTALLISFSDLGSDPRVDRQITALGDQYRIVAAGLGPPRDADARFVELRLRSRTGRQRLAAHARLLLRRYHDVYWRHPTYAAALERLNTERPDVVIANDLYALPLALRLGAPVVYDAHEYAPMQFADRLWWRVFYGPYVRWQCRRYIPRVAAMTTVSPTIATAYSRDTGIAPIVVTNAPPYHALEPTSIHSPVRVLHHGAAIPGRKLEEMVKLADLLDERFTMDFALVEMSPGYVAHLSHLAEGNPRVRFIPPFPMHEIPRRANHYDIGVHLLPPANFNQRAALPNKIFEFIQARLAVAIGPSPEMAKIVRRYNCGVVADDFRAETLAEALNDLDPPAITALKLAAHSAAAELCAEGNAAITLQIVDDVLAKAPAGD